MRENQIIFKVNEPESGIDWNVRVLEKGDSYGRDECLIHEEDRPVIEFFDADIETTSPLGSFTSSYYLSTFNEIKEGKGLCLEGSDRDRYSISSATVEEVKGRVAASMALSQLSPYDSEEVGSSQVDGPRN